MTPATAPPSQRTLVAVLAREAPWPRLLLHVPDRELGLLPVIGALVLLWAVFGLIEPAFLSAENLVNLTLQSVPTGVIALGVVLVLLVGQIDLSVGSVSGLAAAVVGVTTVL